MEEKDVGRVLAAAVPEDVPVLVDLHHRARALGRRRRTQRRVLAVGGAGVATAAVAAAVFGVFPTGHAGPGISPSPGTATPTATKPSATPGDPIPSKPLGTDPGSPLEDDRRTAQAAVKAFEATLPAGSTVTNAEAFVNNPKARFSGSGFGVMVDVVEPSGRAYLLQVLVSHDPYGESWDCDKPIQCSDARFLGHAARWQLTPAGKPGYGGSSGTAFTIRDLTTDYDFGFRADNKDVSKLTIASGTPGPSPSPCA